MDLQEFEIKWCDSYYHAKIQGNELVRFEKCPFDEQPCGLFPLAEKLSLEHPNETR
jgi:hypothetical protein